MRQFTAEEIKEVIRVARLFAHGFNEGQYHKLTRMQTEMADQAFIDSAYGLLRLEREHGVRSNQALDRFAQLVEEVKKLEPQAASLQQTVGTREKRLAAILEATSKAEAQYAREEKELASCRQQAESEKKRLREEVAQAAKAARVEQEDVASAAKLKAELERYGLTIEAAAKLLGEFAGDKGGLKRLAEAVAERGSLIEARVALQRENEAIKQQIDRRQEEAVGATAYNVLLSATCQQLTANVDEQKALRGFRSRYQAWAGLLDCLAGWKGLYLMRCHNPLCGARVWLDRYVTWPWAKPSCPCCHTNNLFADAEVHAAVKQPADRPVQVRL